MKILIYDNNPADLSKLCTMLESLPMKFFIDKISHYEDCIEFYNKYHYEIVFIDFVDEIGKKILSYILGKNPKQKVVTISDIDECSEKSGCNYCTEKYNKMRVTKPIMENELFKIILKKESCPLYCNDDLLIKLEVISKSVHSLTFNKEKLLFVKKGQNYHRETTDMIHLTSALTDANIQYSFVSDGVKILSDSSS